MHTIWEMLFLWPKLGICSLYGVQSVARGASFTSAAFPSLGSPECDSLEACLKQLSQWLIEGQHFHNFIGKRNSHQPSLASSNS